MGTLVYDGGCGFCTASAHWVLRRLRPGHRIVPWQDSDLDALGLTRPDVEEKVWWVDDHEPRGGHAGIAAALRACRAGWPLVGAVVDAPGVRRVSAPLYSWVSRNRYRLPG